MENKYSTDLLTRFFRNSLYLTEIEKYKTARFTRKYGDSAIWNKSEVAQMICDRMGEEYFTELENIIKADQKKIIESIKEDNTDDMKELSKHFVMLLSEDGNIFPFPDVIEDFAGKVVGRLDNVYDIQACLKDFERENYKIQTKNMCDEKDLMDEMKRLEEEFFN